MKRIKLILLLMTFFQISILAQTNDRISSEVKKESDEMLQLCKQIHQNPELSFHEIQTADLMAGLLEKDGLEVTRHFGGNSVVGIFKNGPGPVVMLRCELDALPVQEKTGLPFASTKQMKNDDGKEVYVMHACGHDIHMSVLAGTVRALVDLKDLWKGTLMVITQQAEEVSGGATPAIESGLFQKFPVPDYALAYHINPELVSGTIGLAPGPVFAGVKSAEITVYGKGGHGAYPEKCIDPIIIASRIVLDLQTIVSREISPLDPIVVTVGSIHGGTRPNIIPDEVKMQLTLRYYNDEAIAKTVKAIKRICDGAALTAGMPEDKLPYVEVSPSENPPVLNDASLTEDIGKFSGSILGTQNIVPVKPAMVSEDFGKYGRTPENVPICMIWLGSTNPDLMAELKSKDQTPAPLHSSVLQPDYQKTIETGIKGMVANVIGLMEKGGGR